MRTDLTSRQVVGKLTEAADIVDSKVGENGRQVQRYIRFTELPPASAAVRRKKVPIKPAVELSYLKPEEQQLVAETIVQNQPVPTQAQAQQLKKLSQSGGLDSDSVRK